MKKIIKIIIMLIVTIFVFGYLSDNYYGYSVSNVTNYFCCVNNKNNSNISVAILDTGINHKDINDKIIFNKDFVNNNFVNYDDNGHGTAVAGIIAGNGFCSNKKYIGLQPNINIVNLKIANKDGEVNYLNYLLSLEWVINNAKQYNIKIICMSIGFNNYLYSKDQYLTQLFDELYELNIITVTSSGNDNVNHNITFPGTLSKVITVGSLNYNPKKSKIDKTSVSSFSSYNIQLNKPDFLAPGEKIITTGINNLYSVVSGTSFSAAIITGQIIEYIYVYDEADIKKLMKIISSHTKNKIIYGWRK